MYPHVGLLTIVLDIPSADTLKDKRRILKGTLERFRKQMSVSVCEIGFQNRIRSALIAAAFIGTSKAAVDRARSAAEAFFEREPRLEQTAVEWYWL
jgi:uncharacterized protein YlxP (DUF503 family)